MASPTSGSPNVSNTDVRIVASNLLAPDLSSGSFRCRSAPQSRAGSFKKLRRSELTETTRSSLPSLEDSIVAKLQELKRLEEEDCCVVRQFLTSPGGIVNRGDSFRKNKALRNKMASGDVTEQQKPQDGGQVDTATRDGSSNCSPPVERCRRVLIMGDHGVGKTALLQQFMTSQYMAAMNTSFDGDSDKTLSVLLNDEETLINFVEFETSAQQDQRTQYSDIDCYVLLYSITDRKSYNYIVHLLDDIHRQQRDLTAAIIVVANKSDIVRKRQISEREAKELCSTHACKYISVSAVLNHRVDELLVGIVCQIRLRSQPRNAASEVNQVECVKTSKGLLERLFFSKFRDSPKPCENLMSL